jgi:hypothetical protein
MSDEPEIGTVLGTESFGKVGKEAFDSFTVPSVVQLDREFCVLVFQISIYETGSVHSAWRWRIYHAFPDRLEPNGHSTEV